MIRVTVASSLLVAILTISLLSGCAGIGTSSEGDTSDPTVIMHRLETIEHDIANTEEYLKGSKAELQINDSQDLRNQIRQYEMELYELQARKAALEEELQEIQAEEKSK
jgi:phosphotransacetylase